MSTASRSWVVGGALAFVVVTYLAFFADQRAGTSAATSPPCRPEPTPSPAAAPPSPPALVPQEAAGLTIDFGKARGARTGLFFLKTSAGEQLPSTPGLALYVKKRPLVREGIAGEIPAEDYTAYATVTGVKEVTVTVCMNATQDAVDPGTYQGSVRIEDNRIQDVSVPVTVTLQYAHWRWVAWVFGWLVLIAGTGFIWATVQRNKGEAIVGAGCLTSFRDWVGHNVLGVGVGATTAVTAFIAAYWRNPAWGARAPEDWFALLGAMFAAFTAGLAAGSVAKTPGSEAKSG